MFKKWKHGIVMVKENDIRYFYIEMDKMVNTLSKNFSNMQIISNQIINYQDKQNSDSEIVGFITYRYTKHQSLLQFVKDKFLRRIINNHEKI